MSHYVCQGTCGAASDESGVCHDENCTHHNQPMEECGCEDMSMHAKKEEGDTGAGDLGEIEDSF